MKRLFMKVTIIIFLSPLYISNTTMAYENNNVKHPQKLTFAVSASHESPISRVLQLIYADVSKRLGITIELKYYPAKRASLYAESGKVDGEAGRAAIYIEAHPNLIRVKEHFSTIVISAYAVKPSIKLQGWESLKNYDLKVDYVRGLMILHKMLPKVVKKGNLSIINSRQQGLKKLIARRTDVYIDMTFIIEHILQLPEFETSKIYNAGAIQKIKIHTFLNKKHKRLEPKLSTVFKKMRQEGLIKQHMKTVFEM